MKKIYTFLLLIAVSTAISTAQNKDTKKADQLYDRLQYTDAAEAYQKLLKRGKGSRYVFTRLANSYYYLNDTQKAETFYKRVIKGREVDPEVVYNYAQSLKANGKFSDYNTYMKQFAEMKPDDSRAKDFMKNPNYVPKIMEEVPRYSAKNMEEINSEYSDFGGYVNGKDFYFTSARNTTRKKYGWNEQPYLDIYKAEDVGGTIKNANLLDNKDVNTKYHESTVAISPDGKRMYFDRNDYFEGDFDKSSEGINQINLYYAELIDGKWKGIQSVPWNNDEYSTGHPALSPNGNKLYFVSDMPGGKGMSDIYVVDVKTDGTFGTPQRLGDNINTEGKEVFPYVDSNGTLYFSSDGHQGIGLLDVFMAEAAGNGFSNPENMGLGVNSAEDDFAYSYNPATETGYVSSNRAGGKGSDDIYVIKKLEVPCEVEMNIVVMNEYTDTPIAGARVDMYDAFENKLSTRTTGPDGRVTFRAECDKAHEIQAVMQDFESNAITVPATSDKMVNGMIELRPIEAIIVDDKVVLNPIFFDLDKHNIKPQAAFELDKLVAIMQKYPKMKIKVEAHTDNRASDAYNLDLSERRAQSTVQYVISKGIDASRISGEGFGESKPAVACGTNCTEAQHSKNRRSEFLIIER
ncbi:OmpA family protein [Constantimarinum furrinae]|uniref:Peptidoglycan-associated lipoprotein n=1 Tax=Constantimarinum furrinae TaxID=2562285 RepID=A0A7G8PSN7_9FLAO|nr:OmpA family protein [Constantimarinum furrinae]QNJ97353.1 peptidoglycan-associated lipoprotein [Constantimarinum furrinae]